MNLQYCVIPLWWREPCMLYRPAPQIVSRPVTSVNAVGLPPACTPKITNLILTDCFTNRTICVVWGDMTFRHILSQGLVFRKFQFPLTQPTLPTERSVKLCCHLHTLKHSMVTSVVTPRVAVRIAWRPAAYSVAVWYSGTLDVLQLTVSIFQTNKSRPSIRMWRSHVTVPSRSALRKSGVSQSCVCGCILCSVLQTVQPFSFVSWYSLY